MGRLPFGLANDTPYPLAERVNKFTIDDVLTSWSASDDAPRGAAAWAPSRTTAPTPTSAEGS